MNFLFNDFLNRKKATAITAVAVVIAAVFCVLFGDIILPPLAALYAVLILVDVYPKKAVSIAVGAVLLIGTVVLFLFDIVTLTLPFSCIIGVLLASLFSRGISKAELAFYITLAVFIMFAGSVYLFLASLAESFSVSAVFKYATELYPVLREKFTKTVVESAAQNMPELSEFFNEQSVSLAFDNVFPFSISAVVVLSFALAGFTLKIFTAVLFKLAKEPRDIVFWRFYTSNVIAYFYCIVLVLNFFSVGDGIFSVVVGNLFLVFLVVYAYIGYNFALSILSRRISFMMSVVILFAAVLFLGLPVLLEILSVLGVIFTHLSNKINSDIHKNML